jgi:hypothetical protein
LLTSSKPVPSHALGLLKVNPSDEVQQAGPVIYAASDTAGGQPPTVPVSSIITTAEQGAPGLQPADSRAPCAKYVPIQ